MSGRQTGWFRLTVDAAPSEEELDREMMVEEQSDDSQLDSVGDDGDGFELPGLPMWGFYLQPAAGRET
jgi:hypothetical protein